MKLVTPIQPLILFILFITLISCSKSPNGLQSSTGKPGEILVVAENKVWQSFSALQIRDYLSQPYPGLPQPEPRFTMIHINPSSFNRMLQGHHAVLKIESVDGDNTVWMVSRNIWSQPQVVISLRIPHDPATPNLSEASLEQVAALFDSLRIARDQQLIRQSQNDSLNLLVKHKFEIDILIPRGYFLAKETGDFIWLRKETRETGTGIIIFQTRCSDTSLFTHAHLLGIRDTMLRRHIPGPAKGSFMTTHSALQPPIFRDRVLNGHQVTEIRGLWETQGDYMGGPFISYSVYRPDSRTILTIEGYVYAPGQRKAPYIRQMEGLLKFVE